VSAALHHLDEGAPRTAHELVAALGLRAGARPRVVADMISSADGRAAVQGRSVALGHPADRALLRALRAGVDAILVGRSTMRAERYARLLDEDQRAARVAAGLPPHPIVVTVARTLELPLDVVPLFAEPGVPIVVATESSEPAPEVAADLSVLRFAPGTLTLTAVVDALVERYGVLGVLCEGGPTLLTRLVAEGRLDDLLLTISPLLAAGAAPTILEGPGLEPPARLALRDVHRAGDHVFLHYAVGA
jgi:riboflavin biosynthesis pyrimidine reductase